MASSVTPAQRDRLLAGGLVAVAVSIAVMLVWALTRPSGPGMLGDLEIYKGAISSALSGQPLYDWVYVHPTVHGLGFTYPPFAALVLAWLVPMELLTAKVIWTVLTLAVAIACLALLVRTALVAQHPEVAPSLAGQVAWTAGLAIPFLLSYPFLHDLVVGQVSLFVIALALFDHQLPRRWQGVLIGLAAAIKLTPLVFVPYFLITRQWRQAAVALGTFLGASLIAFVVMPQASVAYWTDKLWQTGRVGRTDSTVNKSLLGLLVRGWGDGTAVHLIWLLLAAVVAVLAYWWAWRSYRSGDLLGATLMVGSLSVAVSPISWPHHQLWLVLVAAWWLLQPRLLSRVLGGLLFAIFVDYPAFGDYGGMPGLVAANVELPSLAVLVVLACGPRSASVRAVGSGGREVV